MCAKIVYNCQGTLSTPCVQKLSTIVNFQGVRGALSQQGHVYLRQGITSISQTVSFRSCILGYFLKKKIFHNLQQGELDGRGVRRHRAGQDR